MNKRLKIRYITKISVLSAAAIIIMMFEIPLWFAPPFYKIDLSEIVVLIGGFALGPLAAILIEGIKILLNLLIDGTITAGVGEAANFILGCSFVLPAVFIYRRKKTFKSALIGMVIGTIALVILGGILNLYILLPVYAKAFNMPIETLVKMGSAVNPNINSLYTLILWATIPFNILKGIICSTVTILLYKRLSKILHK